MRSSSGGLIIGATLLFVADLGFGEADDDVIMAFALSVKGIVVDDDANRDRRSRRRRARLSMSELIMLLLLPAKEEQEQALLLFLPLTDDSVSSNLSLAVAVMTVSIVRILLELLAVLHFFPYSRMVAVLNPPKLQWLLLLR